jgi:hypothetical protein
MAFILLVWGTVTLGFAYQWGSMEKFENKFDDTTIDIE